MVAGSAIRRSKRDRKKTVSYYDDFADKEGRAKDHEDDEDEQSTSSRNEDQEDSDVDSSKPRKPRTPAKKKQKREDKGTKPTAGNKKRTNATAGVPKNPSRQQVFTALQSLAKKVFPEEEEDSLAYRLIHATENCNSRKRKGTAGSSSYYSEGIQALVNDVLSDDNRVDVLLLNLIWRCIGAKTMLSADDVDNWSDDDWVEHVDQAVKEMEESEQTLLAVNGKPTLGTAEFQKMYTEFWHIMAQTAPAESLENTLARLMELQAAGVADLRWAICLAVYAVGDAALEFVHDLRDKVATADRQYKAAKKTKSSRKSGVLKGQLDEWLTKINELNTIVKDYVMVIFTGRYRDAEASIRVLSIDALGRYAKMNQDFATSMYYKYVGWMLSDRTAAVRRASLLAVKAPFEVEGLDWKGMASVIARYTSRIVECTEDVDHEVQEAAMDLLLTLFRNDLLDEAESDMWPHLNSRALAKSGTTKFRRDALYLVLGQLSEFDEGSFKNESHAAEQISQLSHWLALEIQPDDKASDENQHLDGYQIERVDFVVQSLRQMPEHKKLTTNWSAFLRFLHEEERRQTDDRELETLKQAVVLRMVSKSAESCKADELEDLTLTMLRVLPDLLSSYKSEIVVLQNLISLPTFFHPKTIGVSSRKKEFTALIQVLSDIFCETTDIVVAKNCCCSLAYLAESDHSRKDEALLCLTDTAAKLRSDLVQDIAEEDHKKIKCCLQRLSFLSQRCNLGALLESSEDDPLEHLSKVIYEYVEVQLKVRKLEAGEGDESKQVVVPAIWSEIDSDTHSDVAQSICQSHDIFISLMAWVLKDHIKLIDRGEEPELGANELSDNMAVRLRVRALHLLSFCFDASPSSEDFDDWEYAKDQLHFLEAIRLRSLKAYTDICTLFPSFWTKAKSKFLKACAWDPKDEIVRSAASNFVRSQTLMEKVQEDPESFHNIVADILLPFVRSVLCTRFRLDVSKVMHFVAGYGKEAQELIFEVIRTLKKPDISRILEAQITYLQLEFEMWGESEPEDPDDCPTDTQLTEHDAEVDAWDRAFQLLLSKAGKFATSLGFGGQLRDAKSRTQLLKFVKEGVYFSFRRDGDVEPLHLGVRVPFLFLMAKYGKFVKSHQATSKIVEEYLNEHEKSFREDQQFESEIDPQGREMEALEEFRRSCGFGNFSSGSARKTSSLAIKKKSLSRPRMSTGSSVSSIHSKTSKDSSSLDPIDEEEEQNGLELASPEADGRSTASRALAQGSVASTFKTENDDEEADVSPSKTDAKSTVSSRISPKSERSPEVDGRSTSSQAQKSATSIYKSEYDDKETGASLAKTNASSRMSPESARSDDESETIASPNETAHSIAPSRKSHLDDNASAITNERDNVSPSRTSRLSESTRKTIDSPQSSTKSNGSDSSLSHKQKSVATRRSERTLNSGASALDDESVDNTNSSMRPSAKTIDTPSSAESGNDSDGSESLGST